MVPWENQNVAPHVMVLDFATQGTRGWCLFPSPVLFHGPLGQFPTPLFADKCSSFGGSCTGSPRALQQTHSLPLWYLRPSFPTLALYLVTVLLLRFTHYSIVYSYCNFCGLLLHVNTQPPHDLAFYLLFNVSLKCL